MKKKKQRIKGEAAKLEMTPMIDVVFQLLIFFLVTIKQEDILAHLDVNRPAPESTPPPEQEEIDLITILVYNQARLGGDGFSVEGRRVSIETLDQHLTKLARMSRNVSIVIKCTGGSPHSNLVKLLNICARLGLTNLNVFSM
jgi:biopolymer transport protein ExbD